ncbi:hypothetical protein GGR56DRAFT_666217 [Xylariaceae sp. FL0804]|nr:hypothetical protein GGR56DRAFT_666217 [Xylariaceae sp. FL0804]
MSANVRFPPSTASANINQPAFDRAAHADANFGQQQPTAQSRPVSGSYFPYAQPQPQHPPPRGPVDDQTLSNTLANSHIAPPPSDSLHVPARQPKFTEEWDASVRGSSIIDGATSHLHQRRRSQSPAMQRSNSVASRSETAAGDDASIHNISLSRGNTLKKKSSLRRSGSLKRSGSRRSMKAGSVRSLAVQSSHGSDEAHSAFYCPVPTSGSPTEILANRFQTWRKVLKDLIAYFREIQSHYEHRSKSLLKLANVLNNTSTPPGFLASGGLDDALQILRDYHKNAIVEANKAREIEEDVILALTGLRSDLNQKMKEIKSLSGDFKNTVEKEMDGTRRAVNALQDILGQTEMDSAMTTGKQDPYLLKVAVDRQVDRQLYEENYLHKAYLNLETSGRELESIVVGEIQKSYNAYAGILKREADASYNAIDELRVGPVAMPKDHEWNSFIQRDAQFVDPDMPLRSPEQIMYPGKNHFACQELRAGLLERKSKYLKSYTAGWYVLSPTHLHEFKSADKSGAPVMSLYLPEQKLGSHSTGGGSSNKFILKGRQTGSMHRGHTWVFRAESHDTMMAWYEDIKALTEKSPEELSNFVKGHARTYSRSSQRSISSDGMMDEEDDEPFSADPAMASPGSRQGSMQNRPEPGGRFPSDLEVNAQRGLKVPLSPSSTRSALHENEYDTRGGGGEAAANVPSSDHDLIAAAGALPGSSGVGEQYQYPGNRSSQLVGHSYGNTSSVRIDQAPSHAAVIDHHARADGINPYNGQPGVPPQRQNSNSNRFSNAPIVVAGPTSAGEYTPGTEYTTGTSTTGGLSQDSGIPSSYDVSDSSGLGGGGGGAQQEGQQQAFGGQQMDYDYAAAPLEMGHQQQYASAGMGMENGFAKAQPTAHFQQPQNGRVGAPRPPNGDRTNSTPHVPGEYPRSTPATTPGGGAGAGYI